MATYVFIDSRINNAAMLPAGLAQDTQVVVIDAARNGFAQMAQALTGVTGLAAIHIISHGSDGALYLGDSVITSENIGGYASDLQTIGASLAESSDILLYGCDVAAKPAGQRFIEQLARLAGADVAASSDATGSASLGGNWRLEACTGAIESVVLEALGYTGLLDVINGDNNPNNLPGTINDDLITGLGGNDTIDGAAGFDTSIYNGPSTGYGFSRSGANLIVTDVNPVNGNEGADQLINVEAAQFTDGTITFGQAGESRVNTYVSNTQANASITALASGGFVVTWQSVIQDGSGWGVYAQRYGASGITQGSEFRVNTTTTVGQQSPATAGLTGGGFVVAWMSQHNGIGGAYDIYAQRYDANGSALGGEFLVNTFVTNEQQSPAIVALANGGFVVTWQSFDQTFGNDFNIRFQRYDTNGVAQGPELPANADSTGPQTLSAITQLTSGDLVIAYDSQGNIRAQRFDSAGSSQGLEFFVNTYITSTQSAPTIAALSGGGFVVSWHSLNQDGSGYGIYAQRYSATESALGPEFRVNTTTSLAQTNPAIAALTNGGFVVAWESADSSSFGIYTQRYDANGAALGGEFRINVNSFNSQLTSAITALADGGFVVTWESTHEDPNYDVYARRFDAAGNPVGETILTGDAANNVLRWTGTDTVLLDGGGGSDQAAQGGDSGGYHFSFVDGNVVITDVNPGNGAEGGKKLINIEAAQFTDGTVAIGPVNEFRVNTFITNSQDAPAIATLADGGYVVAWNSFGQDNAFSYGIYAQRYDAAGRAQGAEFRVNTFVGADQLAPTIAALNNGGFVVAWQSSDQDGSQYGIYAQRYDAAGNAQGGEFRANTVTADQQIEPAITALANGGFVLTWTSANQAGAGTGFDIYARRYDANGVAQGNEFLVNTFTANIQDAPAVAALANGGFVVTWESFNQAFSGSEYDIYARRYDANGAASGAEFLVQTGPVANNQIQPSIAVLRDGGFIVTFLNDANSGYFLHRFDANGVSQGSDFQIALSGLVYGIAPVAALADGGFVVTYWTNGGGNDVYVQRFNAAGVKVGSEISVNSTTANPQELPAIAALPDGGFVVTWQSAGQDSDYGIYARRFDSSGNPVATTLTGDGGNNNIVWTGTQAIVLDGGAGADTLSGGGGNDIYFTDGLDTFSELLNAGIDTVKSSAADYTLGDNLENLVLVGTGNISGGGNALANRIAGNNGNNALFGDAGADTFQGNAGNDELRGGAGNDALDGGLGTDTADYTSAGGVLAELWRSLASNDGQGGSDTLISIENLTGSGFNDVLAGDDNSNVFKGGVGVDALYGGGGIDTADYSAATGGVFVELWKFFATNDGQGAADTLVDIENLTGSAFADILAGDNANNVFKGGAGNDAIFGGGGSDTADYSGATGGVFAELWRQSASNDGQGGADVLVDLENLTGSAFADTFAGDNNNNVFKGGAGVDALFGGGGSDTADYSGAGSGVFVELWKFFASNDGQGGADTLVDIENVNGSAFADTFAGDNNNNVFKGGAGVDAIFGGGGIDTADYSGAASGTFVELWRFFASNDGQGGADTLVDIENLTGSAFNDTFAGDNNNNVFKGGAGVDALFGGGGIDTISYADASSGVHVELWQFFASNDGQGGADTLVDMENVTGSAFADVLAGDNNANRLEGAGGTDVLYGGGGADSYAYGAGSGVDYIGDFIKAQGDKIHLQSNLNGSGITTGALALAHTSTIGGNAVVDLGGGNSVTLVGVTAATLSASDFLIF